MILGACSRIYFPTRPQYIFRDLGYERFATMLDFHSIPEYKATTLLKQTTKTFRFYDPIPISFFNGNKIFQGPCNPKAKDTAGFKWPRLTGCPKEKFLVASRKTSAKSVQWSNSFRLRALNEFLLECPSPTSLNTGVSAVPPKKQTFIAKLQSLSLLQKTTFACVRVGCLTVKGLPDTALVADMAAIVANLRFNGLTGDFFSFSGHEKNVKGRFRQGILIQIALGSIKFTQAQQNCP